MQPNIGELESPASNAQRLSRHVQHLVAMNQGRTAVPVTTQLENRTARSGKRLKYPRSGNITLG
jgi:hypothetical protein